MSYYNRIAGFFRTLVPDIIRTSLRLILDAKDTSSYSGSGDTWTDIGGVANNFTRNHANIVYNQNGYFNFNGTTASGQYINSTSGVVQTTGGFTVTIVYRRDRVNYPFGSAEQLFTNSNGADGYRIGFYGSNPLGSMYALIGGAGGVGYTEGDVLFSRSAGDGTWQMLTWVFDRAGALGAASIYFYQNTTLVGSFTIPTNNAAFTDRTAAMGYRDCCALLKGHIAYINANNIPFTSANVLQNYNALKAKFLDVATPLDLVSNTSLVGAWGMRKLRGGYTGNIANIRRSNDNATANIGADDNGNFNTVALATHVGSNSGFVATLYDQSTNGYNLTQGTNGNQPRIRNSGTNDNINSIVSIQGINASSTSIGGSIGTISSQFFTVILVAYLPTYVTNNRRIISTSQNGGQDWGIASAFNINSAGGNWVALDTNPGALGVIYSNTPVIITAIWTGSVMSLLANGLLVNSVSNTNTLTINQMSLFGVAAQFNDCRISECIMFSRTLTVSERVLLESNMANYYHIPYNNLILDNISNTSLIGAWSLRKLRGGYTGNAVQVRTSSGNGLANIAFSANGDFDTIGLAIHVASNSGFIATWYDQSGNSRDLTQGINANQPRIRNSGTNDVINSKVTIKGSNSNQASIGGSIGSVSTSTFTIVLVVSLPAFVSGNRRIVSTNNSGNSDWGITSTFNLNQHTTNGVQINQNTNLSTTLNANTPSVLTAIWNGSTRKIRINGTEMASENNSNTIIVNDIDFFGATYSFGDFSITESIAFGRALTTAELQLLERDMGAYYGITVA